MIRSLVCEMEVCVVLDTEQEEVFLQTILDFFSKFSNVNVLKQAAIKEEKLYEISKNDNNDVH